jgi:hypothetical protein
MLEYVAGQHETLPAGVSLADVFREHPQLAVVRAGSDLGLPCRPWKGR